MIDIEFEAGKCFICKDECDTSQCCHSCMRKLSLNETHIPVNPKSYTKDPDDYSCGYCESKTPLIEGHFDLGIRYCTNHKIHSQIDMKKWLIKNNSVFLQDLKTKHRDLYRILENGIPLRRSSGIIENGWKIDKTKILITKKKDISWILTFCKFDINNSSYFSNKILKNIPISFLLEDPFYIPIFKYMLKELEKKLENGFYNE